MACNDTASTESTLQIYGQRNQTQQDCCGVGYVAARGLAAAVLNTSLEDDTSKKPDSSKVSSTSRQVDFLTHVMKQRKT